MSPEQPSANGASSEDPSAGASLPPVRPPSALFILQLFLVPGILVGGIVVVILLFFGWVGGGPETPEEFLAGLTSGSATQRWKTAQDLAQTLPRKESLRSDVGFALDLCEILAREMKQPLAAEETTRWTGFSDMPQDLMEFLPAAVGNFRVPVGLPLLQQLVADNAEATSEPKRLLRLRNAVMAIGMLGARLAEYDALPSEEKTNILDQLDLEASEGSSERRAWAQKARQYLQLRDQRQSPDEAKDFYGLTATLRQAAAAPDEMTRKLTVLALANWDEPGVETVLRQLCGSHRDIPESGFVDGDAARGEREIRYNAALALARRNSPLTPWDIVLETLDETTLAEKLYPEQPAIPIRFVLKALHDLRYLKEKDPEAFRQRTEIVRAVETLAQTSPTVAIRVEADKLLGGEISADAPPARVSRELLLISAVGGTVLFFLALAVIARWRRSSHSVPASEDAAV